MSIIDDLIQVIENDDHILLSKLIENGVDLNTKIINNYGDCFNCNECTSNQNCSYVKVIFCEKCRNIRQKNNGSFLSESFVEILFDQYLDKSLNILVDSDFDFSPLHPECVYYYILTPLYHFFSNNDIVNFEKMAKKDICLNTVHKRSEQHDIDLIHSIIYENYKHDNAKYLKILFDNGLKDQSSYPTYHENSWIYQAIENERYECANILLKNNSNINCQIVTHENNDYDKEKIVSLFEYTILGNSEKFYLHISNNFKYNTSKTNRIINFFIENGFDTKTKIYNEKLIEYLEKKTYMKIEIKSTFLICILHKTSKHTVSDFFKTNPGLYKYIGGKISNYIV